MNRSLNHPSIVALFGFFALVGTARADVIVEFDSENTIAQVGETFDVRVIMTTDDEILGWGLDLIIGDEAIASLTAAPIIGPLWDAFVTPDGDGLGGLAFPDPIGPGNDFLLTTLTFTAHEIGETELLLDITATDLTEGFAINPVGGAAAVFHAGTITVIPAPSVLTILLVGAAALSRRRR